jgi:hypothetical protein
MMKLGNLKREQGHLECFSKTVPYLELLFQPNGVFLTQAAHRTDHSKFVYGMRPLIPDFHVKTWFSIRMDGTGVHSRRFHKRLCHL